MDQKTCNQQGVKERGEGEGCRGDNSGRRLKKKEWYIREREVEREGRRERWKERVKTRSDSFMYGPWTYGDHLTRSLRWSGGAGDTLKAKRLNESGSFTRVIIVFVVFRLQCFRTRQPCSVPPRAWPSHYHILGVWLSRNPLTESCRGLLVLLGVLLPTGSSPRTAATATGPGPDTLALFFVRNITFSADLFTSATDTFIT